LKHRFFTTFSLKSLKGKQASKQASKQAKNGPILITMLLIYTSNSIIQLFELQKIFNLFSRLQNNIEKIFHFPETI
jgi:O-acetylhomoserine/O-acetylserine sulfhydrylase-like pyridoxal-dependent enzyme